MDALYVRISSLDQKTDRQLVDTTGLTVFEDRCSGSIPFHERPAGKRILEALTRGEIKSLTVHALDRLGRSLLNVLQVLEIFNEAGVPIEVRQEGIRTLNPDGTPSQVAKLLVSVLGMVAEMENRLRSERQREGIRLAKAKGNVYTGRKPGSVETRAQFLGKLKVQKIIQMLKRGLTTREIQAVLKVSPNLVTKVRRVAADQLRSA